MWRCPIPDFVNEARSKPLWIQFNCVRRRKVYESHHDALPLDDFFYSSYYMEDKLFRSFMSGPSAWPAWLGGSHRSWAPWLGGIWGGVGCEKPPWEAPCLGAALSSVLVLVCAGHLAGCHRAAVQGWVTAWWPCVTSDPRSLAQSPTCSSAFWYFLTKCFLDDFGCSQLDVISW